MFDDEEGGELQEELLEDEGVAAEEPSPASAPAPKADRNEMRMKLQQLARKHKVSRKQQCCSSSSSRTCQHVQL